MTISSRLQTWINAIFVKYNTPAQVLRNMLD